MISRRNLIGGSAILAGAAAVSGRVQAAAIPEAPRQDAAGTAPPADHGAEQDTVRQLRTTADRLVAVGAMAS